MSDFPEFQAFPKISRLRRHCVITEKIDGSNAQVHITEDGRVLAGSRNRWITPEADNYGFARWVKENEESLKALGPGTHYGEWWGQGIQRKYGLTEKRFSLFNAGRWSNPESGRPAPACCGVVPVLAQGNFSDELVQATLAALRTGGSVVAPGFMQPEGIVIYLTASGHLYKVLLENDDKAKGEVAA